jgi:tryptophan synthase alpha subunit
VEFIFMLTRDDQTVANCLELVEILGELQLRHVGFKDVGVGPKTLALLQNRIKDIGAASYLEMVSTSPSRALESARMAVDLGVDCLMGGTRVKETLDILDGSGICYLPFAGTPVGHPTRLAGTPEQVAGHCRQFEKMGCAGVDLLAYRATDAAPADLVRSARAATSGRLVVAGSISTADQIRELDAAGAAAFTIGTAAIAGSFSPQKHTLHEQVRSIMNACSRSLP